MVPRSVARVRARAVPWSSRTRERRAGPRAREGAVAGCRNPRSGNQRADSHQRDERAPGEPLPCLLPHNTLLVWVAVSTSHQDQTGTARESRKGHVRSPRNPKTRRWCKTRRGAKTHHEPMARVIAMRIGSEMIAGPVAHCLRVHPRPTCECPYESSKDHCLAASRRVVFGGIRGESPPIQASVEAWSRHCRREARPRLVARDAEEYPAAGRPPRP